MDLNQFLERFVSIFEDTDPSEITAKTVFKDLEEWDSLTALSIIGIAIKNYGVKLTGAEIRDAVTVEDIYNLISSKK
jgi:acyl carrier protein